MRAFWISGGAMGAFFYHKYKVDRANITKEAMQNCLADPTFRNVAKMRCCQIIVGINPTKAAACVNNTYKELQEEINTIDNWLADSVWTQLFTFPNLEHEEFSRRFNRFT